MFFSFIFSNASRSKRLAPSSGNDRRCHKVIPLLLLLMTNNIANIITPRAGIRKSLFKVLNLPYSHLVPCIGAFFERLVHIPSRILHKLASNKTFKGFPNNISPLVYYWSIMVSYYPKIIIPPLSVTPHPRSYFLLII